MTPEEHAEEIERLITGTVDDFATFSEQHQRTVLRKVQERITSLTRTKDGRIKPTAANIKEVRKLSKDLSKLIITPKYRSQVKGIVDEMEVLRTGLNVYLLETFGNDFKPSKAVFETIFENAVLLTRGTLTEAGLTPNVIAGIEKILVDSVTGGMRYADLLKQLRFFVIGDETHKGMLIGSGKGKMNMKALLRDSMNQFQRNYRGTVETGLGIEWYLYCCGTVQDSRPFCVERVGHYFHVNEIRTWHKLSWKGKNPIVDASNIFVILAGFGCMHGLYATATSQVPKEDIDRAKRLGFI